MTSPLFLEVALPLPLDKTFHYGLPPGVAPNPSTLIGRRVRVSFGRQEKIGYVVSVTTDTPSFEVKPAKEIVDPDTFLSAEALDLAAWLATHYGSSLGEALACFLPAQILPRKRIQAVTENPIVTAPSRAPFKLTPGQKSVFKPMQESLRDRRFEAFLLRGVTSSGKTEVYLRLIDDCIASDRQALYLLPEIALTPLFIERLREYFGDKIRIWHSGLTPIQRYETWRAVADNQTSIVLGARSALFMPFKNLGIIILDEEHEPSYKQEDRPRYHARTVAMEIARRAKAIVVMGSATPSIESYWRAEQGEYRLLELTSRIEERALPPVRLISMARVEKPDAPKKKRRIPWTIFSEPLLLAMEQRLARREQIMLFMNRRGFTPFMRCNRCGWVARCDRCSLSMVLHLKDEKRFTPKERNVPVPADAFLQCHGCFRKELVPIQCPSCKHMQLAHFGVGTQRIEDEVKKRFPFIKLARLDRDAATSRHVYERVFRDFRDGRLDLLIGTQMIAKGFDFPRVTLVGVVDADVLLHLPDFRSAERTFQLVTQIAGRTGRGPHKGEVVVQTHQADHPALVAASHHDFLGFYKSELELRELLKYPPFTELLHVVIRAKTEMSAQAVGDDIIERLKSISEIDVLGPASAPYAKLRGQFRYHIVIKGSAERISQALRLLKSYKSTKAYVTADYEPADLL